MGFARIFSGTVKRGQKVYVIQPKKQDQVDIDN
jgi:translation elongation factor EF-G